MFDKFDKFTDGTRRVMALAREEARGTIMST